MSCRVVKPIADSDMSTLWLCEKHTELVVQCYFGYEIESIPVKFRDVRVLLGWLKQACFHEKGDFVSLVSHAEGNFQLYFSFTKH